jgi:hypothetical protein
MGGSYFSLAFRVLLAFSGICAVTVGPRAPGWDNSGALQHGRHRRCERAGSEQEFLVGGLANKLLSCLRITVGAWAPD